MVMTQSVETTVLLNILNIWHLSNIKEHYHLNSLNIYAKDKTKTSGQICLAFNVRFSIIVNRNRFSLSRYKLNTFY